MIVKILVGVLCGSACYFILADVFRLPYVRTSKAVNNLAKSQSEKTSSLDVWLGNVASFFAKRAKIENDLPRFVATISKKSDKKSFVIRNIFQNIINIAIQNRAQIVQRNGADRFIVL